MPESSRTSHTASQDRPVAFALAGMLAVTLALTLVGCHSASSTNPGSSNSGSPLVCWPQSPFTSQHDQMAKAVKNDPFPDANQPLPPLGGSGAGNK